ncbi:MAG: hypothetical protein KGD64_01500 [Candidatus Heimdallarchaeota archaeon]|nr:hypothetical protein [Candidatus Heimdallarchaeota archaeon]
MSLKAELEEISKNSWGIGIFVSWGIFIVFSLWNMIASFIFTATITGNAGQGVISIFAVGSAALYLLTYLIAEKVSYSKEQLYLVFSLVPLVLLFIMAVVTGYLVFVILLWPPYTIMLLGSIGIIVCTYFYIKTKEQLPEVKDTIHTEDEI